MPIYEYYCKKCKKEKEEVFLSNKEVKPPICEHCKIEMKRKISKGGFLLKGNGWYNPGSN